MTIATSYWVVRPGHGELRREGFSASIPTGVSRVRAEFSGVSPGTERLVGLGLVPAELHAAMACRAMAGSFDLPIKYGYCLVGRAIDGALAGERVFTMHPHQDVVDIADGDALVLPHTLPPARAVLIANLETAWNAVWDASPQTGEKVAVVGAGVVGLSIAHTLRQNGGAAPIVVELDPARRAFAARLPFVGRVLAPEAVEPGSVAVAFHTSGTGAGLQTAIDVVGFEGRVIDASWYGTQRVTLDLGTTFHSQRKRIIASQVGAIALGKRATHTPRERLLEVVRLLDGNELDALLSVPCAFAEMPAMMQQVYGKRAADIVPLVQYGDGS